MVFQLLHQVRRYVEVACLNERLRQHARNELDVSQPLDFVGCKRYPNRIIRRVGLLLLHDGGTDATDLAFELWCGLLVERRNRRATG